MSQVTKRALEASLKKLLLERPLDKITVTDIAEDCGINRMTFYYHFRDIYDLVEWACQEDARRILDGKRTYTTWQEGFRRILDGLIDNRPFILNVYRSVRREQVETFLFQVTHGLLMGVVEELDPRVELVVSGSFAQALERLLAEGCTDVVVQPTHVMNGEEYHKLLAQAEPYRARFARMTFGRPLLTAAEDYAALGRALMEALPAQRADTAVLYMGHGSEHQANSAYALMEYTFHDLGRKDVVIGTVEGYPGFGEALRRLKERPQVRRVELRPLMTVAGDHAKNDLAGDEEDSWRRRLEAEGYETACVLTGLGEYPAVRALFVEHARQAEQLQAEAC